MGPERLQQDAFRALADPTRREILRRLRRGSRTAGELSEGIEMSRASLSHHFNTLKAADLVRSERRGQYQVYSLNTSVIEELAGMMLDLFQKPGDGR